MNLSSEPFAHLEINVGSLIEIANHAVARRRLVPLLAGTVSGPIGSGVVLPGGSDWQWVDVNGRISLDAHYVLELDTGERVEVESSGIRVVRADGAVYFRTGIRLTAPPHRNDINDFLFLSAGTRTDDRVILDVFRCED
jgi:hypothetical protein